MSVSRRAIPALALVMFAALACPAWAAEPVPYTDAAFTDAQQAGKPILVDSFATWCDICKRQKPIIDRLLQQSKYKDLVTFKVNFDTQKDVLRKFNAPVQSTLIVFRGSKELGRSVGETQEDWIDDLMSKTTEGAKS